jgi:cell filamentation protein
LYDFAGEYRTINIEKSEMILGGLTVKYGDYQTISNDIKNIIDRAQNTDVDKFSEDEKISYIANLMTELWKIHSFREGITRCVIIFICKYLESLGIGFNNKVLKRTHYMLERL